MTEERPVDPLPPVDTDETDTPLTDEVPDDDEAPDDKKEPKP